MIKPKYPKRADISQIARSIVEHATGEPLTPDQNPSDFFAKLPKKKEQIKRRRQSKH